MATQVKTNLYYALMVKNLDFWIQYLSVHFPFTEPEILEYWDVLFHGTAFYTDELSASDWTTASVQGLCFNQNVRWTKALRDRWDGSIDDLTLGKRVDEFKKYKNSDESKSLVPLNLYKERQSWFSAMTSFSFDREQCMDWIKAYMSADKFYSEEFGKLTIEELEKHFQENRNSLLFNRSIWYNTMYYEISEKEVFTLLRLKRYSTKKG